MRREEQPAEEVQNLLHQLTPTERAVFEVLNDEFTSASVVKFRAQKSSGGLVAPILDICRKLERLGFAEHKGSGLRSTCRWRRARRDDGR